MVEWKSIETAPFDTLILMKKDFEGFETPMVVVGEVINFKGATHYLCRGPYDDVIDTFNEIGDAEKPTHWANL